jgi:hypothetical protein
LSSPLSCLPPLASSMSLLRSPPLSFFSLPLQSLDARLYIAQCINLAHHNPSIEFFNRGWLSASSPCPPLSGFLNSGMGTFPVLLPFPLSSPSLPKPPASFACPSISCHVLPCPPWLIVAHPDSILSLAKLTGENLAIKNGTSPLDRLFLVRHEWESYLIGRLRHQ